MKLFFEKYNPTIYCLYAIMLLLPFGGVPVVYCIVVLILDFIVQQKWELLNGLFNLKNPLMWLIAFYFLITVSIFWTSNFKAGAFELEQKLSFLIIPVLVYANRVTITDNFKKLLMIFIIANFIISVYAILRGVYIKAYTPKLLHHQSGYLPFYSDFSPFLHVAYASFYIAFSTICLLYYSYYELLIKKKVMYWASVVFFLIPLYYLSSKAVFLAFAIMLFITFIHFVLKSKHPFFYLIIGISIFLSTFIFIKNNPRLQSLKRMSTELMHINKLNPNASSDMSNGQRFYVIKSSIEVIKNNFLLGVGAGDVIDELENQYLKSNYRVLAYKKLNCHNQFLESFVELGIVGFIVFLFITIGLLIYSVTHRFFLLAIFLLGFIVVANTESFLNHQAGVVFFTLFVSILVINSNIKKFDKK